MILGSLQFVVIHKYSFENNINLQQKTSENIRVSLNLFILHRLRNKLSAYINYARCLHPGDLTSTRAVCVERFQSQDTLIAELEPGTLDTKGRRSTSAPLSSIIRVDIHIPMCRHNTHSCKHCLRH